MVRYFAVLCVVVCLSTDLRSESPATRADLKANYSARVQQINAVERATLRAALDAYLRDKPDAQDVDAAWLERLKASDTPEDAERVLRDFKKARPRSPQLSSLQFALAEILVATGDPEKAKLAVFAALDKAAGKAHETQLAQNLAALFALKGDRKKADECYDLMKTFGTFTKYPKQFGTYAGFQEQLAKVGTAAEFDAKTIDGRPIKIGDFAKKPVLLHFWQPRLGLAEDMPHLTAIRQQFPNVQVVSVAVGDDAARVRRALEKYPIDWPQVHDADQSLSTKLGITFMGLHVHAPKSIVVGSDGKIKMVPTREGLIEIVLRDLSGKQAAKPVEIPKVDTPSSVRELKSQLFLKREESLRQANVQLLKGCQDRLAKAEGDDRVLTVLDTLRQAEVLDDAKLAKDLYAKEYKEDHRLATALRFALARALMTSGDKEATTKAVYAAVGDRKEREDLYLLMDLSVALSVLGDVEGARKAYDKIVEVAGTPQIWNQYAKALDRVGKPVKEIKGKGLDGKEIGTGDFKAKVLLVDFWFTNCHACIHEMPHVYEAYQRWKKDGFEVLAVAVNENEERVNAFLARHGYPWPQVLDTDGKLASPHTIVGYPTTILVDGEGKVRCIRAMNHGLDVAVKLLLKESRK